jgi:hypothetical protein
MLQARLITCWVIHRIAITSYTNLAKHGLIACLQFGEQYIRHSQFIPYPRTIRPLQSHQYPSKSHHLTTIRIALIPYTNPANHGIITHLHLGEQYTHASDFPQYRRTSQPFQIHQYPSKQHHSTTIRIGMIMCTNHINHDTIACLDNGE